MTKRHWNMTQVLDALEAQLSEMYVSWDRNDMYAHLFDDLGFDSLDGFEFADAIFWIFELDESDEESFGFTFTMKAVADQIRNALDEQGRWDE